MINIIGIYDGCYEQYDEETIYKSGLGGSESWVIAISEALAQIKNTHIPLEEIKSAYIKAIGFNKPEKFLYIFLENLKIYLDNKTVDEIQNYVKDKKGELLCTI